LGRPVQHIWIERPERRRSFVPNADRVDGPIRRLDIMLLDRAPERAITGVLIDQEGQGHPSSHTLGSLPVLPAPAQFLERGGLARLPPPRRPPVVVHGIFA